MRVCRGPWLRGLILASYNTVVLGRSLVKCHKPNVKVVSARHESGQSSSLVITGYCRDEIMMVIDLARYMVVYLFGSQLVTDVFGLVG